MPCIALGAMGEDEDEEPVKYMWATSCAVGSESGPENSIAEAEADEDDATPADTSPWLGKRVVFLEIDGVLNTRPEPRQIFVEKVLCVQLRRLLDASKAEIVLTTSWRKHHEYIAEVLKNFGGLPESYRGELHRAPLNAKPERRDLEILQWVNAHRDIAGWVALDCRDLQRFPAYTRMEGHTIQVDPIKGLTGEVVEAALKALGCGAAPIVEDMPHIDEAEEGARGTFALAARPARSVAWSDESQAATLRADLEPGTSKFPLQTPASAARVTGTGHKTSDLQATAAGTLSASSMQSMQSDLSAGFSNVLADFDGDLAAKMKVMLDSLPHTGVEHQPSAPPAVARSDKSRAEFEAVMQMSKEKFKDVPKE